MAASQVDRLRAEQIIDGRAFASEYVEWLRLQGRDDRHAHACPPPARLTTEPASLGWLALRPLTPPLIRPHVDFSIIHLVRS